MQRAFRAVQKLLDNNPPASVAETGLIHHVVDRGSCRDSIGGDDNAFAQRKPIRLDHDRKPQALAVMNRFAAIGKCACFRRGNFLRVHQFFCKDFR